MGDPEKILMLSDFLAAYAAVLCHCTITTGAYTESVQAPKLQIYFILLLNG
jgi:hypothetical protein